MAPNYFFLALLQACAVAVFSAPAWSQESELQTIWLHICIGIGSLSVTYNLAKGLFHIEKNKPLIDSKTTSNAQPSRINELAPIIDDPQADRKAMEALLK